MSLVRLPGGRRRHHRQHLRQHRSDRPAHQGPRRLHELRDGLGLVLERQHLLRRFGGGGPGASGNVRTFSYVRYAAPRSTPWRIGKRDPARGRTRKGWYRADRPRHLCRAGRDRQVADAQGAGEATTILDGTGLVGTGAASPSTAAITNVTIQDLTVKNYAGTGPNSLRRHLRRSAPNNGLSGPERHAQGQRRRLRVLRQRAGERRDARQPRRLGPHERRSARRAAS